MTAEGLQEGNAELTKSVQILLLHPSSLVTHSWHSMFHQHWEFDRGENFKRAALHRI